MSDNDFKNKVKGTAKEEYGKFTDDAAKELEGKKDQLKGEAEKKIGDIKDKFNKKKDD